MESENYFNLKYNEDIFTIFNQNINYLNYHNIYTKHKNHMDLYDFIFDKITTDYDNDYDIDSDSDDFPADSKFKM
mgnify:CR=1 FL=1|tara:strand:- start:126 stop:350 length:225 start_codon:yes stop_codon:yes gene_type:complete